MSGNVRSRIFMNGCVGWFCVEEFTEGVCILRFVWRVMLFRV